MLITEVAPRRPRIDKEHLTTVHYRQIIRDLGLKVTQQRIAILDKILKGRDHVTAQEVYESVVTDSPDIGFATVYRFLHELSESGFVTELRMKGLPARYEWAHKDHHDHLTCVQCGAIREFENAEIEALQLKIAESLGFVLTDHILELYGICEACNKKPKVNEAGEPLLPTPQKK